MPSIINNIKDMIYQIFTINPLLTNDLNSASIKPNFDIKKTNDIETGKVEYCAIIIH